MRSKKRLLGFKKLLSIPLLTLSRLRKRHRVSPHLHQKNTGLEAKHRRLDTRGSIDGFVGQVWDASENPPGVGELLRKHRLRTKKDEGVQEKQEEKHRRNIVLTEFSKRPGYDLLKAFLQLIEGDAYFKLRNLKERPENVSMDSWVGIQNGRLEVVEDIRLMFATARAELKRERIDEQKKEGEKNAVSDI
jgi:hypothetical protein